MSAWPIPRQYAGQTVAVIAGGPSATPAAIASVRQHPRIAVRNAYQLAPNADVLLSLDGDDEWFAKARASGAGLMLSGNPDIGGARVHYIGLRYEVVRVGPQDEKQIRNSGLAAVRVAAEMGASRILLVGFDPETPGYAPGYEPGIQKPGVPYTHAEAGLAAIMADLAVRGVTVERVTEPAAERFVVTDPLAPPDQPAPAEAATDEVERPVRRRGSRFMESSGA